jgi:hypothetical protein
MIFISYPFDVQECRFIMSSTNLDEHFLILNGTSTYLDHDQRPIAFQVSSEFFDVQQEWPIQSQQAIFGKKGL